MSDYSKLTVVRLREELIKRGLAKTGNKAILIDRLVEADAQAEQPSVEKANVVDVSPDESIPTATDASPTNPAQSAGNLAGNTEVELSENAQSAKPTLGVTHQARIGGGDGSENRQEAVVVEEGQDIQQDSSNDEVPGAGVAAQEVPLADPNDKAESGRTAQEITDETESAQEDATHEENGSRDPLVHKVPSTEVQSTEEPSNQTELAPLSTQTTVNADEILEDSKKRKRRSQSPPPSSIEASNKRAKALDGSPRVTLPEDINGSPQSKTADSEDTVVGDTVPEVPVAITTNGIDPQDESLQDAEYQVQSSTPQANGNKELPPASNLGSPLRASPSDTRYKNLFTVPDREPSRQAPYPDTEDRIVSPAFHPATSALYIRGLQRPLQPAILKNHLRALGTSSTTDPSAEIISEFFLDTVRTHCLVKFSSTHVASRVRLGLHNRIWPDERDRKALWVDFIPEEKLATWMDVESKETSGKGQAAKRWEVVYEMEVDGMKAYLQEADTNHPSQPRPSMSQASGQGVQGAPSGPRVSEHELPAPRKGPARQDGAKGFKALDDLFKSTTAKPKLYFLPVSANVADRRLAKLAAGRGGGRGGDEMKRYTFEGDMVVDRGPEFGYRGGRGGGRGGYAGGHSHRGRGWRGEGRRFER